MKIKWFSAIRVTGLCLVLLYHFFKKYFPGGFIGVDLFFTFSGYLVTAVFLDEFSQTKRIDLGSFARRRLYRIVPPLVLTILVTLPFALLIRRDFLVNIGHQVAAALGFVTNFYELLTGGSYEAQFAPHLLVHTWSLAIEVQFYLFWALVIWLLSKTITRFNRLRGTVFLLSLCLFVVTFLSMVVGSVLTNNYSSVYFSSFTHVFPFFLGACLATLIGLTRPTKFYTRLAARLSRGRLIGMVLVPVVVLVTLGLLLDFNHLLSYLLGFLLSSLSTLSLIVALRVLSDRTPEGIKEPVVLSVLADISYGLYLFHWPFYTIFSQLMGNGWAVVLTLVLSVSFSVLSFYILEPWLQGKQPKIFGWTPQMDRYRKPIYGSFAALSVVLIGLVMTAPVRGEFESRLLVNGLHQSHQQLTQIHQVLVGDEQAIADVLILGDSITLNASQALDELLPEAELDAVISRSFITAYDNFQNRLSNNALAKTVVLAVGVNSVYNYEADIQVFLDALPAGHRLVIVTPYNITDGRIPDMRAYELSLLDSYPYLAVADWYQVATEHPSIWLETDGVHFSDETSEGADLYAQTIKNAILQVAKQPAKN